MDNECAQSLTRGSTAAIRLFDTDTTDTAHGDVDSVMMAIHLISLNAHGFCLQHNCVCTMYTPSCLSRDRHQYGYSPKKRGKIACAN